MVSVVCCAVGALRVSITVEEVGMNVDARQAYSYGIGVQVYASMGW